MVNSGPLCWSELRYLWRSQVCPLAGGSNFRHCCHFLCYSHSWAEVLTQATYKPAWSWATWICPGTVWLFQLWGVDSFQQGSSRESWSIPKPPKQWVVLSLQLWWHCSSAGQPKPVWHVVSATGNWKENKAIESHMFVIWNSKLFFQKILFPVWLTCTNNDTRSATE